MEQADLIREARNLLNRADERRLAGEPEEAKYRLVQLRKLLNDQPDLEAGAALKGTPAETPAEE